MRRRCSRPWRSTWTRGSPPDEDGFTDLDNNRYYQQVKTLAEREGAQVLPICAKLEQDIAELEGEERQMFLEELGVKESGLDRQKGHQGPQGRREDSHGHRAGLHPGGGHRLRGYDEVRQCQRRPGEGPPAQ